MTRVAPTSDYISVLLPPLLSLKILRILPYHMPDMSAVANPQQRHFDPYAENGGTILAVAGADFTVIAGDTRQSEGYSIQTRYASKVFRLSVQFSLKKKGVVPLTPPLGPTALCSP